MQNRLFCVALFLAGYALPTHAQVVFQAFYDIALHAGGGGVTFTLEDKDPKGAAPIPLAITAGPILDKATHSVITGAAVTFASVADTGTHAAAPGAAAPPAPTAEGAKITTSIGAGEMLSLTATVKGISGSSEVEIPIVNGTTKLGIIRAFASDAALNISVDGDGSAPDKSLAYTYGGPVVIALKNGDAQSYHLKWDFQIDNQTESSGDFDMPAGGNSRITITPSSNPFALVDLVHPSNKKAVLLLSTIAPASANIPPGLMPARTLQVSLVMQRHSALWSSVWSYSYVGILLWVGGIFSFLASSMLPNMQKKGDLRAQLQELANRTSTVSTHIDSYLRVLLRLERSRIKNLIDDAPAWIPASSDPLTSAAASIDNLSKRLAAAERLDDLRRKHDQVSATAPPSVTDGIDANLQAAADQLHSLILSDSVLAAANGFFAKAQASLDMLDDTAALAKQIAGNVAAVITRLKWFPPEYYEDLRASLPGVFLFSDSNLGYDKAENIVRPMLFAIDHGAAAMQLALDYAMVRASIPVMPARPAQAAAPLVGDPLAPGAGAAAPANAVPAVIAAPALAAKAALQCDPRWEIVRQRLLKRHCVLIELLGTLSWRALRDATLLVQEMREDTYEEDVLDEICKPGQAEIVFDTQTVRRFQPVFFSIKFKDSRFNAAAAVQRLLCHWTFPGDLHEYTWKACHYFQGGEQATLPPSEYQQPLSPQVDTSLLAAGSKDLKDAPRKRSLTFRASSAPVSLDLYATIRGRLLDESREVPVPALKKTIQVQGPTPREWSRASAEFLRFAIAFGVALAALLSGAIDQLGKLDFIPASIAIIGLGFSASAIKNLLTQSAPPQTPVPTAAAMTGQANK